MILYVVAILHVSESAFDDDHFWPRESRITHVTRFTKSNPSNIHARLNQFLLFIAPINFLSSFNFFLLNNSQLYEISSLLPQRKEPTAFLPMAGFCLFNEELRQLQTRSRKNRIPATTAGEIGGSLKAVIRRCGCNGVQEVQRRLHLVLHLHRGG